MQRDVPDAQQVLPRRRARGDLERVLRHLGRPVDGAGAEDGPELRDPEPEPAAVVGVDVGCRFGHVGEDGLWGCLVLGVSWERRWRAEGRPTPMWKMVWSRAKPTVLPARTVATLVDGPLASVLVLQRMSSGVTFVRGSCSWCFSLWIESVCRNQMTGVIFSACMRACVLDIVVCGGCDAVGDE